MRYGLLSALILFVAGCSSGAKRELASKAVEGRDCQTPLGQLADGATASGFLQPVVSGGATCQSGSITCQDGVWAGAHIYPACTRLEAVP